MKIIYTGIYNSGSCFPISTSDFLRTLLINEAHNISDILHTGIKNSNWLSTHIYVLYVCHHHPFITC